MSLTLIDESAFEQFAELQEEGAVDIVVEIIQSFLGTSLTHINAIKLAAQAGCPADIVIQVHSLKSSAYTVGARVLGDLCARIEADCRGAIDAESLNGRAAELCDVYERSCRKLERYIVLRSAA